MVVSVTPVPGGPAAVPDFAGLMFDIPVESVPTPHGLLITAENANPGNGLLLYVHGGGFEHRNPPLMNRAGYLFSKATGRPTLVVHYRLAPAHPYPAPVDDVLDAYRSLTAGTGDSDVRVIAESSGAALALTAAQRLRDAGEKLPAGILTWSAVTDLTISGPSVDDSPDDPVSRELLTHLIGQYLGGTRAEEASPLHQDLTGLPPLSMVVGGAEALKDDTLRLAAKVEDAEVDVYEGLAHVFQTAIFEDGNPLGGHLLDRIAKWGRTPKSATPSGVDQ